MWTQSRADQLPADQIIGLYEYFTNQRMLFLYGAMTGFPARADAFSSSYISDLLIALDQKSSEPIWLIINGPGGYVDEGLLLYDAIKNCKSPIYTIGRNCYSMAAVILSAGDPGHRYVYPHSKIMLHLPAIQGNDNIMDANDTQIQAKEMNKIKNTIVDILISNGVKMPKKRVLKDIDREFWMDGNEAIVYGLADKFVEKGFAL